MSRPQLDPYVSIKPSPQLTVCPVSRSEGMYEAFGYRTYRRVLEYYAGEEDALDMRKALPRDPEKKSMVPLKHPITPSELEW